MLLSVFLLFVVQLSAQRPSYREYSVTDGLPQSQIRNIFQDSRGYLWITTKNGLSRFDGIEFVNYFRSNGLPDNHVLSVFEDNSKILWAMSNNGISRYSGSGFKYFPLPAGFENWYLTFPGTVDSLNNIYLLCDRPQDTLRRILIFKNGVFTDFARDIPALDTLKVMESMYSNALEGVIILDKRMKLWLLKGKQLTLLSEARFKFIFPDRNYLLASRNDTLFRFFQGKFEPYDFTIPAGKHKVKRYSKFLEKQLEIYAGRDTYKIDLPFNFISYVVDNENVLWFTSEGNMYRLLSPAFTTLYNEDIGESNIWAIAEDKYRNVFFGSLYNSLVEFDGNNFIKRDEYKKLFHTGNAFYKGSRRLSNGDLWLSTGSGVLIWDGNRFSILKGIPENTQVCYIYEDPDNKEIMLGTQRGLYILRNNKIELLSDFVDSKLGVIEGVVKDDNGIYWLSGHNGIVTYDGKSYKPVSEEILPEEFTYTIEKDSRGGIWVTSENGLFYRGKKSDHFTYGLPANINSSANSIFVMDSTRIMVGRIKDVCIIDLKKFYANDKDYFRTYDATDGFMGSDCLDNGIIRDYQGKYWIQTSDNTVILDAGKLIVNTVPPKINLTGVLYQTDSLTWEPVDKSGYFYGTPESIRIKSFENRIQISFNAISMTNPEKVKLQYRLDGFDNKWSVPSSKRFVVYEKIPPGRYKLNIRAFNADGVETPQPLSVVIILTPTFWQRTVTIILMYLLGIGSAVLSILYLIRRRQRQKEEEAKLKMELSRLQMSSVLRQFDPHFTFNVISAIGSLIMKGEKENAYDYITILGGLLRTVLGDGSVIIKPLSEEIDFVRKYCELQKLRFKERLAFSMEIDKEVDLQRTIPKMTIQLFVENAIKHGLEDKNNGGKVEVKIERFDKAISIRITDNGIGRIAAAMQPSDGSGNGLKMIRGLFEVMNSYNIGRSTIEISDLEDNGKAAGTSVRIVIPDGFRFEFGGGPS
jgi:hypothetical protein